MSAASLRDEINTGGGVGAAGRALAALLLLALVAGSFALWVGVPVLVLWALGSVTDDATAHLILGLIAVPIGMVLFGLFLAGLNSSYLRVVGASPPARDEEGEWRPRLSGPLDRIIGVSAVICLGAFLLWLLFGSAGIAPAGP